MSTAQIIQGKIEALQQERDILASVIRSRVEVRELLLTKVKEMREPSSAKSSNWGLLRGYVHALAYGDSPERSPTSETVLFAALTLAAGADRTEGFIEDMLRNCLSWAPDLPSREEREQRIAEIELELHALHVDLEMQT